VAQLRIGKLIINNYLLLTFFFTTLALPAFAVEPQSTLTIRSDKLLLLDATYAGKNIIAVGERGTILISSDAGNTWQPGASPTPMTLTAVTFTDEQHGWAVGHDAVILYSNDGGKNWQQNFIAPEKNMPLLDVWFGNSRTGFAVGAYGSFYQTQDGGHTWQARKVLADDMHINTLVGGADGKIFLAGEAGLMARSFDHGKNWQPLKSPYAGSFFGALRLHGDTLLAFGLRGHIFRSTDFGLHWTTLPVATESNLMGGSVLADGTAVIVGYGGLILISKDQGKTFSQRHTSTRKALATALSTASNQLVLFGEAGVASQILNE
jgi:photosystem II stability/assembly factor-like uncharacterized protein